MRRNEFKRGLGAYLSNRPAGRGPALSRLWLELLEKRQLLSAVSWTIDSGASSLSVAIPDQPINLDGTEAIARVRNQSGGDGGPWNVGNTAQFSGTIDTDFVDGSTIQFLGGQTNILGVNSGNYRPNPADYTGGTINPDGTASGGNFTGTATSPGVFGARFRATVEVFGFPVTVDAAFASFYDTKYDIASDPLPITAGSFPINTTNIGISDTLVAIDGLEILGSQPVADAITRITDTAGPNGAATATITITGPLTRQLTIPISLELSIPVNSEYSLAATATGTIVANATLPEPSTVAGRHLFYNQSGTAALGGRYDGNNLAINASDDNAIATDKTAYLWEDAGAATFANVSSYTKGINGIMVDITGSHPNITADDFIFRVGNNNSPGTWATANAPTSISVRAGAGVSGSDRVTIIWDSGAPIKEWLQVIVLANDDTGLAQKPGYPVGHGDHFFFGNAPGNSGLGDTAINATVNATDEIGARNNPANLAANIPITNLYDYDRNAQVNAADQIAARNNATNPTTVLKYLNLNTAPAAPEADDEVGPLTSSGSVSEDSGVASALTSPVNSGEEIKVPGWIKNRLETIDLNSGSPARLFQHLHDVNTPGTRKLLQKFDAIADSLGLDDELLEELLADLK